MPKAYFVIKIFTIIFTISSQFLLQNVKTQFLWEKYNFEYQKKRGVLKIVTINDKVLPLVNLKQINITNFFNANNRTLISNWLGKCCFQFSQQCLIWYRYPCTWFTWRRPVMGYFEMDLCGTFYSKTKRVWRIT